MNPSATAAALTTADARTRQRARPRVGVVALGGLGGSSRVALQIARGLRDQKLHTTLLSGQQGRWSHAETPKLERHAVPVPPSPRPATMDWVSPLAASLVQAVHEHDLDILSVHYAVGMAAAAVEARRRLAAQGRRVSVCVTLHGTDVTHFGRDAEQGPQLASALRQCDEVTAVSDWLADEAVEILGLEQRPAVIVNGVDTELFRPRGPELRLQRPILCHASNFRAVKRPLDAIAVVEGLRSNGIDASLWMVGDGPLREQSERRAAPLGSAVRFLPTMPHADLAALLSEVDLSLVTSESESFGLFALESMASGVPVLATRCGGLEDVFRAEPSGELHAAMTADVGDIAGLTTRAADLLRDAERYTRVRDRALVVGRTAFPQTRQMCAYADLMTRLAQDEVT